MTRETTAATDVVNGWLLLAAGDPACNDARDLVESLGGKEQQDAARRASALQLPLANSTAHCADDGDIAQALADLRGVLDSIDPSELDATPGWFARSISKVPGVGSSASRYAQRLESSRARVTTILDSLNAGRDVLSRDNITLRSDQERLVELSAPLQHEIDEAKALGDALEFAIDVELPFGDPRRPLFEEELLVTARQRSGGLERALVVNLQGVDAIESVMAANRQLIRGIDRTRNLTLAAFAAASAAGAGNAETAAAFVDADAALSEAEGRRREALPAMERTVRDVTHMTHQETR
ncbi:MAG: toxic anion resistance protein [Ilumatobacter sp.]|uniref:toxic anion resistance protein n=1 Tax=Ilumatobacter sp. TaxID=1967498 RepID=UPI003C78BF01